MTHDQEKTLDEILNVESGLSIRELGFIEDMDKLRRRELTMKQAEWLERIADKVL